MTDNAPGESFLEFKNSFSYGSRPDMNFKFLKGLSEEQAGDFFRRLLWQIGDAADDGDWQPILDLWRERQAQAYAGDAGRWTYPDGPFVPLAKALSASRLALFTSSGHFVAGDDPQPFGEEAMSQEEAVRRIDDFLKSEPQLSRIPVDTPDRELRVRHGGVDVRAAQADPNVSFPLTLLREAAASGRIGSLAATHYSFTGACSQLRLLRKNGPAWVEELRKAEVDGVILVPV